ncbi:ABC-2 type transport system permease protein [Actinoplanes octamycinicus]|uniref:ABC-2 type transport system permease protein n=1 Tax=Actinoplanes octamycinicus TaxID=135948 RepID=A0A7W7GUW2_9ACTN|nr:ABC transporter permease subunit [Actinoplanes octamycinicus]MBB4738652.1 ABC-2 type transport system permease protein [Actinoplanes octamycinicus]GIE61385.1 ABC transporter permease [Actinoplanes octamycinicus]
MIAAEVRKLRTVRSPWVLLLAAQLVVIAGVSGLMLGQAGGLTADGQRDAIAHAGLVSIFALVLGILAVSGEYRHRTITDTYLTEPRRERVVLAKLAVNVVAGLVFGLVAATVAVAATAIWVAAKGGTMAWGADLWQAAGGAVGWNVAFAALGVGVGALVTNPLAAIAGALAWIALVEGIVGQLFEDALSWLPFRLGPALEGLGGQGFPSAWSAALALSGYVVAFVAAAVATTIRRDVS